MAMSAASMKTKILAALAAAGITYDAGASVGNGKTVDQVLTAICTGIIGEIVANSIVSDTPNDGAGHTHLPHHIT